MYHVDGFACESVDVAFRYACIKTTAEHEPTILLKGEPISFLELATRWVWPIPFSLQSKLNCEQMAKIIRFLDPGASSASSADGHCQTPSSDARSDPE